MWAWYVASKGSLLHVSAAGRVRRRQVTSTTEMLPAATGSAVFVADNGNHTIWRVELATGAMTTVAGSGEAGDADGVGDAADFCDPAGIAISPDGGALYVADFNNFARSGAWRWRLAR